MTNVSDYTIIRDSSFYIGVDGDIDQEYGFRLQDGAMIKERSILSFVVERDATSGRVDYEVLVNGSSQIRRTVVGSADNTVHELVGSNALKASPEENIVEFRITSSSGGLRISDVYLQYQQAI
jgi:hypothetical protein